MKRKSAAGKYISREAIEAWQKGDVRALHDALEMGPFEFCPLPRRFGAYGLPDEPNDQPMCAGGPSMLGWAEVKAIQDELRRIAREPGAGA